MLNGEGETGRELLIGALEHDFPDYVTNFV
jgi:hypothetical protein